jgi:hypothetical protein
MYFFYSFYSLMKEKMALRYGRTFEIADINFRLCEKWKACLIFAVINVLS